MNRAIRIWMGLILGVAAVSLNPGCGRITNTLSPEAAGPYTPIASNSTLYTPAEATDLLSTGLYNFYQGQGGNVFFSPFSIITAMAMAQEGAAGDTQTQMQNVLNLNPNASVRLSGFQSLINEINAPGKHYTLNTADNLWLQAGFSILPSYLNTIQTYYAAGVTNVDFVANPTAALQTINGAVSQETAGYISNLLSPASINSGTKLVLTNAIYFKGTWANQFPVSQTVQQTFNLTTSTSEPVSMMKVTYPGVVGNYNGAASVLAIPYANNEASMYVFLPPPGGMAALESQMTGNNINTWLAANASSLTTSVAFGRVALSLPKFTFSTSYDLTSTLSSMGMPLAFTRPGPTTLTGANFWNLDGTNNLYITDVVHKAYVDVDETGSTAAGATGVVIGITMTSVMPPPPPPVPFVVDHPFIFMIIENTTNTVLFMGRVNDPLSAS